MSQGNAEQMPTPSVVTTTNLTRGVPLGDLLALGTQLRDDVSADALLQEVAEAIHTLLGYPQVYVRQRNADTDALELCAHAGVPDDVVTQLRAYPTAPTFYQALLHPRYRFSDSYLIPIGRSVEREAQGAARRVHRSGLGALIVPLRGRGDRLIGAIYVEPPDDPAALALPNVQVLEAIARQAALALENARLADRTARLLAKEQLLAELGRDVSTTLDLDTILNRTVDRLGRMFHGCAMALLNEQHELVIVASVGAIDAVVRSSRLRADEGICGWVIQHGLPYLSNDVDAETRVQPAQRNVGSNQQIRSYISVPLRTGGRVIGTLSVEDDQANAFTYEDVDLLEAVAAQIGGPIASAQLYREAQRLADQVKRRNDHLTVLNALARTAVSTLDVERMLAAVTEQIQLGFGYGHVELYMVDEERQELVLVTQAGMVSTNAVHARQSLTVGVLGRTYGTAQIVWVDDVRLDPDYVVFDRVETRSELCVPIIASGRVLAILNLESRRVSAFTDEDVGVLATAADVLASAIENARLYQRAQEAAVLEERSRLARDLHDSISQQLFSMTLTAQAARAQLEKNPARSAVQLERLQETATVALAEMRALIHQLRPPGLSDQGLIAALQQHVSALGHREGLTVHLDVCGEERYARGFEQAIYRIAQEALNNIIKHAGACSVAILLELQPEQIMLRVSDDGRGFDLALVGSRGDGGRHLGLTSMRERAAEIGGYLELRAQPDVGTDVVLIVPRATSR